MSVIVTLLMPESVFDPWRERKKGEVILAAVHSYRITEVLSHVGSKKQESQVRQVTIKRQY